MGFKIGKTKAKKYSNYNTEDLKNIDITGWEWPKHGVSDSTLDKYEERAESFALKFYDHSKDAMKQLYLDTFQKWREANDFPVINNMDKMLEEIGNAIDKCGWAQYAYSNVPQGWWHFVNWIIDRIE